MTAINYHVNQFLDIENDRCSDCGGKFWGHTAVKIASGHICGSCAEALAVA